MRGVFLLAAWLAATAACAAEVPKPAGYPERPVHIIVPFAAGGGLDISVRLLGKYAEPELGEQVVVQNRTQGGNVLGNLQGIQAKPDGHTLGCWGMGLVTDELVIKNVPYTHDDVTPVCMYASDPHLIAVSAAFARRHGIRTLGDLFAYVRAHPGQVTFGSGGNWTSHDFLRLGMEEQAGIRFMRMPFLGGGPALRAAATDNCDVVTPFAAEYLSLGDANGVVLLAVAFATRLEMLPDVPTTAEEGYPELVQTMWRVITVPLDTPRPIVDYLEAVFHKAVANPEFVAAARELGINPQFMGSAELDAYLEEEFHYFTRRTAEWGIQVDARERSDEKGVAP